MIKKNENHVAAVPPETEKEFLRKLCGCRISKRIRHIIMWPQFPPNYLKKNPPQNYVQKSGKLAQGSSKTHTQQVGFQFTISWAGSFGSLRWTIPTYHCTDGQQKCKQVTIPTYHCTD